MIRVDIEVNSLHEVSQSDVADAQKAYEKVKAYRRNIFMRAIAEKKTYRWIADAVGLSAGNIYQLVNKTNYKKK